VYLMSFSMCTPSQAGNCVGAHVLKIQNCPVTTAVAAAAGHPPAPPGSAAARLH
jgi:hypothetical protein